LKERKEKPSGAINTEGGQSENDKGILLLAAGWGFRLGRCFVFWRLGFYFLFSDERPDPRPVRDRQ
jgi:hypothetical protein